MPPSGFSWKRAWALLPWPTWRTPPGFLAVRSTATTRTRSRSAWRCAIAPSARSRYPTKTPGCRRWISSCAPAWAFSASAGQLDVQPRRQFAALHRPADLPEAEALPLLLEQLAAAQQRLVLVAAFALEVEDLQHPLHRTRLAASICNRSGTASAAPWPGPSACATIPGTAPNACSAPASTACAVLPTCCWRTPEGVNRPPSGACAGPRRRRPPAAGRLPR